MKSFILLLHLISASFLLKAEDTRTDVLHFTNEFRRNQGQPELTMRDDLNAIAQKHSENMARGRVKFGHGGFSKREDKAKEHIKDLAAFAENVAFGPGSGEAAVEGWKKSAGHRTNMLGNYRYIGIGIASDRKGRLYFTQVFVN